MLDDQLLHYHQAILMMAMVEKNDDSDDGEDDGQMHNRCHQDQLE